MSDGKEEDFNYNLEDGLLADPSFNRAWAPPIDSQDALNNKIISSSSSDGTVVLAVPKTETKLVAFPLLDKNKKPVYKNGIPVIKFLKKMDLFMGFTRKVIKFPVEKWFNDSTTSGFLTPNEGKYVRSLDKLAFDLFLETLEFYPEINWISSINEVYWIKQSFTETSKGIEGEGVKQAKSTYSKNENIQRSYSDDAHYESFKKAQQKKKGGLLGALGL